MLSYRSVFTRACLLFGWSLLLVAFLVAPPEAAAQTTFTVTSTNNSGTGSLRQAILSANATAGADEIVFDIPGDGPHTIQPLSELPEITDPVVIDGLTQPGADCSAWPPTLMIEIDGSRAGTSTTGIDLDGQAHGSTVRGLVINRFDWEGIILDTDDNVVECSFIGTDVQGTQARGNLTGIFISERSGNRIGGPSASQRNLISGNIYDGIEVDGSEASGNVIQGNYIGTDVTGQVALGNEIDGILIDHAQSTLIGADTAEAGNVISGNGDDGIDVYGPDASSNTIQHNYIGVAADGRTGLGNAEDGIDLNDQPSRTDIKDNVIGANAEWGLNINSGARESTVSRNYIGTNSAGDELGNAFGGILAQDSGPQIIGGTYDTDDMCCEGNTIAFNGGPGIGVDANVAVSYEKGIRGNRIYANDGLGIDLELDGVTDNDPQDQDGGSQANRLQNFPVLSPPVAGSLEVEGTLHSRPDAFFRVDVYVNDACDPSGYGEGQNFVGTLSVETDGTGDAGFTLDLEDAVLPGTFFTATAIDGNGNTSEFSQCVEVNTAPTAQDDTATTTDGTPVEVDVLANDADPDDDNLTVAVTADPTSGTATVNGDQSITYSPDDGFTGEDAFTYQIDDQRGGTDEATVTITVNASSSAPTAPQITSPTDGAEVLVGGAPGQPPLDPDTPFTVAWTESTDPNGDEVSYIWELSASDDFGEVLWSQETGAETQVETTLGALAAVLDGAGIALGEEVSLYHRVVASDGVSSTPSTAAEVTLVRGTLTALEDGTEMPQVFVLEANYPNPFNPQTTIRYGLPEASAVRLVVYDVLGREVAVLVDGMQQAGRHAVTFEADELPSGVYVYQLKAGGFLQARRMVLTK